ncbi:MAG: hypothetical protein ABI641_15735 [Caldimonas sp.]
MIHGRRRILPSVAAATVAATVGLVACAQPVPMAAAAPDGAVHVRLLVKIAHASEDGGAIAAEASRLAGVPVRYAAATSAVWHALVLDCTSIGECNDAVARLRAARNSYPVVERDERKQGASS